MSKLLFIADHHSINTGAIDFACFLAKLSGSKLTGVFLETLKTKEFLTTTMDKDVLYVDTVVSTDLPENEPVRARCGHQISRFKSACIQRETEFSIHRDHGTPMQELLTESRYADALIIDSSLTFTDGLEEVMLTHEVKRLLAEAECPGLIAPPHFHQIDELIFSYDGKASSLYAMKQFIYLFPALKTRKVIILEVNKNKENGAQEERLLKEWLSEHFEDYQFVMMGGDAESRLLEYTLNRQHTFIIMGAYSRGKLSQLLHPSVAQPILKLVPSPVFIAHH